MIHTRIVTYGIRASGGHVAQAARGESLPALAADQPQRRRRQPASEQCDDHRCLCARARDYTQCCRTALRDCVPGMFLEALGTGSAKAIDSRLLACGAPPALQSKQITWRGHRLISGGRRCETALAVKPKSQILSLGTVPSGGEAWETPSWKTSQNSLARGWAG